ncbi:MAG TPA: adenylate/guanylate cyclase domain-containing protein [Candidatus Rifleibacterium sp.]|mgnify:FL=1|nr:adenylate/guanylate cyclase domain-containing protein [Candidatus Rifleibacterium sp.]
MNRRLKMALPLVFAFFLTLLPFGLLEYNQHQRALIQHEREILQWEHRAGNYLQLFKSLWSVEQQIRHRQFLFKKARQKAGFTRKFSGARFMADMQTVFSQKMQPRVTYAGIFRPEDGLKMLSGPGFTMQKQRFFKRILEGLINKELGRPVESVTLDSLVRGAFGDVLDFQVLASHRKGKVSRVMFENELQLVFWDICSGSDGSLLVYLQLFAAGETDRLPLMRRVADSLSDKNSSICSVLMPLEFVDPSIKPVFDATVPTEQKQRIRSLYEAIAGKPLERDRLVPAGKFVDYQGVRILRDFIDYAVPYEIWVLSRDNPEMKLQEPTVSFLLRLLFFSSWILVFCKVLISGRPVGISLKHWLTLTFTVVGILPLLVFFVAGIFHIDAAAFRREQEAVKDALQQLEEADASGEVIMAEFRDACRRWTIRIDWMHEISTWDPALWQNAVDRMIGHFSEAGLKKGAVYIYPPDKSGLDNQCYLLPGSLDKKTDEEQACAFYSTWVKKAYHKIAPDLMIGPEPEMSMFHGRTGQEILRIFLSNRSDIEFVDLGEEKQLIYQNYVLVDGKPMNWYFFRFDITEIFEDYLRETITSMQKIYRENFYAITVVDRAETRMLFPPPRSREAGIINDSAGRLIDLATVTRSQLIEQSDDKLVIAYPCIKSGSSVVVNVVFFRAFREAAYRQELLLSVIVLLMAVPVFLISRLTADYLVSPLLGVENGLKRISEEDYSARLHLNREDELGRLTRAFDQMVEGLKERRNLGRFVSAALDHQISQAVEMAEERLIKREGAVLCSDIRSFTSIGEKYGAREVVEMLNEHLAAMSECIRENGGLVEQFIGDAVLAVFHGDSLSEACQKAVRAGIAMMRRHQENCLSRRQQGKFLYDIGVGIEGGELLSGTVTADQRSDYTVVGAARNAAEDLESMSRYGRSTKIMVSPLVYESVNNFRFVEHENNAAYELVTLEERE